MVLQNLRHHAQRFWRLTKPNAGLFGVCFLFTVLTSLSDGAFLASLLPLFQTFLHSFGMPPTGTTYAKIFSHLGETPHDQLIASMVLVSGVSLVKVVIDVLDGFFSAKFFRAVTQYYRTQLFSKLLGNRYTYFDDIKEGQVTQLLVTEVRVLYTAYKQLFGFLTDMFRAVLYIAILIKLSIALTAIFLSFGIVVLVVALSTGQLIKRWSSQALNERNALMGTLQEFIANMKTVRLNRLAQYAFDRVAAISVESERFVQKVTIMNQIQPAVTQLIGVAALLVIFSLTTTEGGPFHLDLSHLFLFLITTSKIGVLAASLSKAYGGIVSSTPSIQSLVWHLDEFDKIQEPTSGKCPERFLERDLVFEQMGLSFATRPGVLRSITLHVRKGERIGIIGHSGSGKTSLINLIARLYDYTDGEILMDGIPLRDLSPDWIRQHVGIITQDPTLLTTTVEENIRLGKIDAREEEIIAAAQKAHAHDFIMELPQQYQTLVGTRGAQLSGGQKQRIAIARTFLKNPELLILDEATSSLDSQAESSIHRALREISTGKTVIVIAHRLSTLRDIDRLVVLDKGRIIETGTWDELQAAGGKFHALYQDQRVN